MLRTNWNWTTSDKRDGRDIDSTPIEILDRIYPGYEIESVWNINANRVEVLVRMNGVEVFVFLYRSGYHSDRIDLSTFVGTILGNKE